MQLSPGRTPQVNDVIVEVNGATLDTGMVAACGLVYG